MIDLEERHLQEILRILEAHVPDCEVRAFGSRVTGRAEKFSDMDLLLVGQEKLDWRRIERLKDALSASNLPIRVDVLDWNATPEEFRNRIGDEAVPFASANASIPKRTNGE